MVLLELSLGVLWGPSEELLFLSTRLALSSNPEASVCAGAPGLRIKLTGL